MVWLKRIAFYRQEFQIENRNVNEDPAIVSGDNGRDCQKGIKNAKANKSGHAPELKLGTGSERQPDPNKIIN